MTYLFDIIMETGFDLGKVGSISNNTITIPPEEFAPAIWAGTEGMSLTWDDSGNYTIVSKVNLDTREIEVIDASRIKVGDTLRVK